MTHCGIDFGTSNSAICINHGNGYELVALKEGHQTTPSALYYPFDGGDMLLGRAAISEYVAYGRKR